MSRNEENDFTPAQTDEQIESHVPSLHPREQRRRRERGKRLLFTLVVVAVLLALVVIVGGSILLAPASQNSKPPVLLTPVTRPGLYAYVGNAVYRLDNRTHQVVWKHTFASSEGVQGDLFSSASAPGQPFVVGNVLYLQTRDQRYGRQYLYAFNTADGSVLWRQPSARALANSTAVYTLVESKTAGSSTLTARDARTGKELWQRQYPIAASPSDPGYGIDDTEGFRLITVTDQLLYAVYQNEQDFFARYGLSPADGSILWQNHEVIEGGMPLVEAKIVNGVVYTTEYYLKSVTPYLDSHGATVTEIPQARAAAYDLATGHLRWQTPYMVGEQPNGGFFLAVSNDALYFQTFNNLWPETAQQPNAITTLHALNARDGTLRWQYQTKNSDSDYMTAAVLAGDSLYFEADTLPPTGQQQEVQPQDVQLQIVALNAQTGQVRWSTPVKLLDGSEKTPTPVPNNFDSNFTDAYGVDMPPVASADTVYYSTPGNRIYAIQSSDGQILAQFWVDKTDQTTVLSRVVLFVGP